MLDEMYSRYRLNKTTASYADMIIKLIAIKVQFIIRYMFLIIMRYAKGQGINFYVNNNQDRM